MDLKALGKKIAALGAPVVGAALGGPVGATVGKMVAARLGLPDDAPAQTMANVIDANPQDSKAALTALNGEQRVEIERLTLAAQTHAIEQDTERLALVNRTMRAEAKSDSLYVRCWRPTFGYVVAALVLAFGLTLCYALVSAVRFPTPDRIEMLNVAGGLVASLQLPFTAVLAVLGVSVAKRSADKAVVATGGNGRPQGGFLGGLLGAMGRGKQ